MLRSWIPVAPDSHFSIRNIPFGVFYTSSDPQPRVGVAIGDFVVDLRSLFEAGLLDQVGLKTNVFAQSTLNEFMSHPKDVWRSTRNRLISLLDEQGDLALKDNERLRNEALIPISEVIMMLPIQVTEYTDFYSSREHATNVGIMFRGVDNALQPNWLHMPIGYHGRASSVVISGTDVMRPVGQVQKDVTNPSLGSVFSPCRLLDFELELGILIGGVANPIGQSLTLEEAKDRIFGMVLLNDWSARDIQAWEYVPLGPFTAKNFATSISAWVVTIDALDPFRCSSSEGAQQSNPVPLKYLQDKDYASSFFDLQLEVDTHTNNHHEFYFLPCNPSTIKNR
jgi:fumarylacetoacetase